MSQKSKTLLGVAAFCILLAGAVAAYNLLIDREDIVPDNIVIMGAHQSQEHEEQRENESEPSEHSQPQQVPSFTMLDAEGNRD